jgi:hypothetical protein
MKETPAQMFGWDAVNKKWVPVSVTDAGLIKIVKA